MKRFLSILLVVLLSTVLIFTFFACTPTQTVPINPNGGKTDDPPDNPIDPLPPDDPNQGGGQDSDELTFPDDNQSRSTDKIELPIVNLRKKLTQLTAVGKNFVNAYGETVYLRGVNAGGLFVTEGWMNIFDNTQTTDDGRVTRNDKVITEVLVERFGIEKTKELWQEYQRTYWTDYDFEFCRQMGANVIRLPFSYMNVDFDAIFDLNEGGKSYDFSVIDKFVATAAKYGMYTILDLHGAYGSQNGQNHSGQTLDPGTVDFYENEQKRQLTVKLWEALAEHFKDNVYVAAYDILNEPAETQANGSQRTGEKHWQFFDEIYRAIRTIDQKHVIIFESCWGSGNLPSPSKYGWTNCAYSMHHYTGALLDYNKHTSSMQSSINSWKNANYNVPLFMGEFTCYGNSRSWDYTLDALDSAGMNYCLWTYKRTYSAEKHVQGWSVVLSQRSLEERVNVITDSYETILEKFSTQITKEGDLYPLTNDLDPNDTRTLFDILIAHLR